MRFKEYYNLINEMQDSKRNREAVINSYGLMDHSTPQNAEARATELINKWTKLEPLIDPNHDYFGVPGNKYNPKDMFSWSRVAKDMGYNKLEALQNFEAMLINLGRESDRKEQTKLSEKDYEMLADTGHATLYRPKSMAASCKLGAGTRWCTSANTNNQFDSYTAQGVVLFYIITKREQTKYAIAMYPDGETFEFFDAQDNKIDRDEGEDILHELGLPTDMKFYRKSGPSVVSLLKNSVNDARSKISGATQRDPYGDDDTNWELLMHVFEKVKTIFKNYDPEELAEYQKYRKDENQPDEVFLMDVMNSSSLEYFTDREYNPPGSNNWSNSQFQQEIVRNINRLTTLTNQSNGANWKQEDIEDMDDLTDEIRGPSDSEDAQNTFHQLRLYISAHMKDKWPELEKALIKHWKTNHDAVNIKVTGGYSEHTDTPFDSTYMWFRLLMDIKNGDWPECEQMIHKQVKSVLHAGGKDPDYENRKNGIQSMGAIFNNAANFYRRLDDAERRAWLPQSDDHFLRYMNGEWDIDGPPLLNR